MDNLLKNCPSLYLFSSPWQLIVVAKDKLKVNGLQKYWMSKEEAPGEGNGFYLRMLLMPVISFPTPHSDSALRLVAEGRWHVII